MTPKLVTLIGAPTAGKSHYAASHFQPAEIVGIDHCAHLLDGASWWEAHHLFHWLIETRVRLGLTVCIDATNLLPAERVRLLEIAAHYGMPATAVLLSVAVDRALARNAARTSPIPEADLIQCLRKFGTACDAVGLEPWDSFTVINT